jgi:hypothetical protein
LRQPQVGLLPDELKHEARFREMAAWLVRRHKPVILLVSAHLLLHGTASGDDVDDLMKRSIEIAGPAA